jgi:MFS family permease
MGMASSPTTQTQPNRLLAVLLVAPFMAQADATIANVAAPSIHADLHTTGADLELVIGGYLIAFAVLLITGRGWGRRTATGRVPARRGRLHGRLAALRPRARPDRAHPHDISGVTTTTTTIAGAIAIAAFGTAYLSLASAGSATHAFAIVTAGFAAIAGLAALLAHGATRHAAVR